MPMTDPAELRQRAAVLRARADQANSEADGLLVQAELASVRPEAESRLAAARETAEHARAVHAQAAAAVAAAEADLREAERRLQNAESANGAADLTVQIEAEVILVAIGKVIRRLQAAVQKAREAESSVAFELRDAEAALERAAGEAEAIAQAHDAPLTHQRGRQCLAWGIHAARYWEAIVADPAADGITPEHRSAAMTCLSRVLRSPAARQIALDVAARATAEERAARPQLDRTDDGNWRVLDYSSAAQPRSADLVRQAEDARSLASLDGAAVADLRTPKLGDLLNAGE